MDCRAERPAYQTMGASNRWVYESLALRRTAAQAAAEAGTPLLLVGGVHDWIAPLHRSSILAHLRALPQAQALLWAEPEHDGHADLLFGATRSEANPALMAQITRFLRPGKFDEMKKSC